MHLHASFLQFALGVQIDEMQQNRYHELLVYIGFQWPQSAGRVRLDAHCIVLVARFHLPSDVVTLRFSLLSPPQQELMSRIKTATERQFNPKPSDSRGSVINLQTDGPKALSAEMQELLHWLKDMKRMIEILKLVSFENLYILRANFGQQLHLYPPPPPPPLPPPLHHHQHIIQWVCLTLCFLATAFSSQSSRSTPRVPGSFTASNS
jgi:hypothetical protein